MKVLLTPEAAEALKAITARARSSSPYINGSASAVTCQALVEYASLINSESASRLAERLLSPGQKRKALLKRLAALAQADNDAAIQVLEKSVRKLDRSNIGLSENEA